MDKKVIDNERKTIHTIMKEAGYTPNSAGAVGGTTYYCLHFRKSKNREHFIINFYADPPMALKDALRTAPRIYWLSLRGLSDCKECSMSPTQF